MKKALLQLFEYRLNRALDDTSSFSNEQFDNCKVDDVYINQFKNEYPLEDFPALSGLDNLSFKGSQSLPPDIFEQLIFSIFVSFQFSSKGNFVNQRLTFFLLNNIFFDEKCDKSALFSLYLYFCSNSEDFIDNLVMEGKCIKYKKTKIDILEYSETYFNLLEEKIKDMEGGRFSAREIRFFKNINNEILQGFMSNRFNNINYGHPFVFKSFHLLYKDDKLSFFKKIESCLELYKISSWESVENDISLYYGINDVDEIESLKGDILKKNFDKSDKLYSEYFIDTFILYYLNEGDEGYLLNIPKNKLRYFLMILGCHLFAKRNSKKKNFVKNLIAKAQT